VLGFDHDDRDSVMASTLQPSESYLGRSPIAVLSASPSPLLRSGRETHDALFSQLGRRDAWQLVGDGLLASKREDDVAAAGRNASQLIDRVHTHAYDLDDTDDDELDRLLGDRDDLLVDAKPRRIQ
jgi:hypothetical protein